MAQKEIEVLLPVTKISTENTPHNITALTIDVDMLMIPYLKEQAEKVFRYAVGSGDYEADNDEVFQEMGKNPSRTFEIMLVENDDIINDINNSDEQQGAINHLASKVYDHTEQIKAIEILTEQLEVMVSRKADTLTPRTLLNLYTLATGNNGEVDMKKYLNTIS